MLFSSGSRASLFPNVPTTVRSLILILSLNTAAISYLLVVLTAYLPQIGLGSGVVGMLIGIQGVILVLAGVPFGILSDRRGRKSFMILGAAAFAPMLFIFALTTDTTYLILASILGGVGASALSATTNATIADQTTEQNRDSAFSLSFIQTTIASGVGSAIPFFFPGLSSLFSVDSHLLHISTLLIFGLVSACTPIALWFILRGFKEAPRRPRFSKERRNDLKTLLKFSGINSLIGLGAGFIIPLIPTWLFLRWGVQDNYSGPLLALSSVTMALAAILSPRLSRRFGLVRSITLTESLSTIFMLSLAFVGDPLLAGALYIIRASLMNMASPLADTFLMSVIPQDERGFASALNAVIWRLPNSATTIVGGLILASGRFDIPFFLATAFYVVSIGLFYPTFRNAKFVS